MGGEAFASALYDGLVVHRRVKPRKHLLRYKLFWMLFDLDEVEHLASRLRWFSHNRFNLFALADRDHLDGSDGPLRQQVEAIMRGAGLEPDGGAIRLLCLPRVLGHAFNPLSVYFCHWRDGTVAAMLYEVNNTFGQRHCYLVPTEPGSTGGRIEQRCDKRFYVSPFMDMDLAYAFSILPPGETVSVGVNASDQDGLVIATSFAGRRRALSDRALLRTFAAYPLVTLKVVGGIHWEAIRIWLKGIGLRPRPPAPASSVTLGHSRRA